MLRVEGLVTLPATIQNQMEKRIEHDMETEVLEASYKENYQYCGLWFRV